MKFAFPHLLLLLWAIPPAAAVLVFGVRRRRRALRAFADGGLLERFIPKEGRAAPWVHGGLLLLAAFFLVLAAARPMLGVHYVPVRRSGVDVVIALDTSASMDAGDVRPSRLERAKQEIVELLDRMRGDRVGLVVFAGEAYVQCPLTLDYSAVRLVLDAVETDASPVPGTALAEAVRTAAKCFDPKEKRYKALVLITDGEDHEGNVEAVAREAAEQGVRLFAIGMGTPGGAPVPDRDADGKIEGYKKDASGGVVMSRLEEETLVHLAEIGRGRYVRGGAGSSDRDAIYRDIAGMEEREVRGGYVAQYRDRFHYAVGIALVLLAIETALGILRMKRAAAWLIVLAIFIAPGADASPASRVHRGNSALKKGQASKALEHYEAALADKPGDPIIRYDMGSALHALGRYDDAAAALSEATASADPAVRADASYNLGNTFYRQGKLQEAADAYRRALHERPEDKDARRNLELCLKKQAEQKQQQQDKSKQKGAPPDSTKNEKSQGGSKDQEQNRQGQQQQGKNEPGKQGDKSNMQEQPARQDSTQRTPADTTGMSRPGRLTREEAERLLQAIERAEQEAQRERLRARAVQRRPGKDW